MAEDKDAIASTFRSFGQLMRDGQGAPRKADKTTVDVEYRDTYVASLYHRVEHLESLCAALIQAIMTGNHEKLGVFVHDVEPEDIERKPLLSSLSFPKSTAIEHQEPGDDPHPADDGWG